MLLCFFFSLLISANGIAETNQLGWTEAQANRWTSMRDTNHPYWQRLKDAADNGVYNDHGMVDGLVYLITGETSYAQSAYDAIASYATNTRPGIEPSRNTTRHGFGALALLYSWVADAISDQDKADFRNILDHWADLVFDASHGTRTVDSDEMTGHYFGVVLFALAIRDEDLVTSDALLNMDPMDWKPVGGLDVTGINRESWRNTIAEYVQRSNGGVWIESSQYNANTLRYLIEYSRFVNDFLGEDKFPEITALIPDVAKSLLQEMTMDYQDSFQWGDVQDPHTLTPVNRIALLALIADLTEDSNMYDLFDCVYGDSPLSAAIEPHFYLFVNPQAPRSEQTGTSSHNASGRGLAFYHSGWDQDDSFFGSLFQFRSDVDHQSDLAGNFGLYREGEWVVDYPRGYGISSAYHNTMLISGGLDATREARGQIAYDSGDNYLYHVGTTGGQFVMENYYDYPPEVMHEWTRSLIYLDNSDQSDSIIVFDRVNASDPLTDIPSDRFERFRINNKTDITNANGQHQWIIHLPENNLSINPGSIEWQAHGQMVRLKTFTASEYNTAIYDETALHGNNGNPRLGATAIVESELKYQLRLIPTQTSGWQTMLNVIHVGGELTATEYVSSSGEPAKGVLIENTIDSTFAIFNAGPGSMLYQLNGNPVSIEATGPNVNGRAGHDPNRLNLQSQLRLFNFGFQISFMATDTTTKIYIADLNPIFTWSASVDGVLQKLEVSSAGLARLTVSASGSHSINVYPDGSSDVIFTDGFE